MGPTDVIFTAANWHAFDQSSMGKWRCGKCAWNGSDRRTLGIDDCL